MTLHFWVNKEKADAWRNANFWKESGLLGFFKAYLIGKHLKQRGLCTENMLSQSGHFQFKQGQTCSENCFSTTSQWCHLDELSSYRSVELSDYQITTAKMSWLYVLVTIMKGKNAGKSPLQYISH